MMTRENNINLLPKSKIVKSRLVFASYAFFSLSFFPCNLNAEKKVLSEISRKFPNAMPGVTVIIKKVLDKDTRKIEITSNILAIKTGADLVRLEHEERDLLWKKTGALSSSLFGKIKTLKNDDKILISVQLKTPVVKAIPMTKHSLEEMKINALKAINNRPSQSLEQVLAPYLSAQNKKGFLKNGFAEITKTMLLKLAFDNRILYINEYSLGPPKLFTCAPDGLCTSNLPGYFQNCPATDLNTLARSAYSHSQVPLPDSLAKGVNVATFEYGISDSLINCLENNGIITSLVDTYSGEPVNKDFVHSEVTFTNLINAAPGAYYYHYQFTDTLGYNKSAAANYLFDHGIVSVSKSVGPGDEHFDYPANNANVMAIDKLVYLWPRPVFFTPSGNGGWGMRCWAIDYNGLNVGNVKDSNFLHFEIDTVSCGGGVTQTRNPFPVYGECIIGGNPDTCYSDRELPNLVVPGNTPTAKHSWPYPDDSSHTYHPYNRYDSSGIDTNFNYYSNPSPPYDTIFNPCRVEGITPYSHPIFMTSPCISDLQTWGTSMSAPTAAGIAGSLIASDTTNLRYWPEKVRAILMLTARNVTDGYWDKNIDGKDGAGVIHGMDAIAFAHKYIQVDTQSSAVEDGLNAGELYMDDFDQYVIRYFNIKIPILKPLGKHLRIVLTWNSIPSDSIATDDLSDLELLLHGNIQDYASNSSDGNVEMVDIDPSELTADSTYTLGVYPLVWRSSIGAVSPFTYYTVAWTWVVDHAK